MIILVLNKLYFIGPCNFKELLPGHCDYAVMSAALLMEELQGPSSMPGNGMYIYIYT